MKYAQAIALLVAAINTQRELVSTPEGNTQANRNKLEEMKAEYESLVEKEAKPAKMSTWERIGTACMVASFSAMLGGIGYAHVKSANDGKFTGG